MPCERRGLTYKKLARYTATDLSILYRPGGQRGEFSNLRNAPVEFFMVTVINDECGNELLNSANVVPTDKKRKRTNWEINTERCSFDAFSVLLRQVFLFTNTKFCFTADSNSVPPGDETMEIVQVLKNCHLRSAEQSSWVA